MPLSLMMIPLLASLMEERELVDTFGATFTTFRGNDLCLCDASAEYMAVYCLLLVIQSQDPLEEAPIASAQCPVQSLVNSEQQRISKFGDTARPLSSV